MTGRGPIRSAVKVQRCARVRSLLTLLLTVGTFCDFFDRKLLHTKELRSGS